jgi:hypothetical protein
MQVEVKPITNEERSAYLRERYGKSGRERAIFIGKTRAEQNGEITKARKTMPVRHAFQRLQNGMYGKVEYQAIEHAILERHGSDRISDLDPKNYADVTAEAREALALHLATFGPILPLGANVKTPWCEHGYRDATQDPAQIRQWCIAKPNCNWGRAGLSVDIDVRNNGKENWAALLMEQGESFEPDTLCDLTPTGGQHLLFDGPPMKGKLAAGVDVPLYTVAPGSHVVANGKDIHATGFYTWQNDKPIASAPPWIAERLKEFTAVERNEIDADPLLDPERAAEMLRVLDPTAYRDQETWFRLMCSYHYVTAGHGYAEFDEWSKSDEGYTGNPEFQARWNSLGVHDKGDIDDYLFYEAVRDAGRDDLVAAAIAATEFADASDFNASEFADADAKSKPNENPKAKLKISATPFVPVDPRSIAPRDWLYGLHYVRKYIVADVSPGGGGKTSNVLVEAISMATGVDLLRVGRMYPRPLRVWYWNGEDPREEVERRVAAICKFYSETDPDFQDDPPLLNGAALERLKENLFLDTGRATPIKIATPDGPHGTTKVAGPLVEALVEEVCAKEIDVLVIDPFVSSHSIGENDNVSIDRVIKEGWVPVAERGNCCIDLVHHTRKISKGAEFSAADARGASAIVDAARNVRVFNTMTDKEAEAYNVREEDRWRFFRVEADKTNMAIRGAASPWRYLESVSLENGRDGFPADSVGVVSPWDPPEVDPLTTEITNDKILKAALDLFNQGKRVTKTHGNNAIKKMVSAFRKQTGMETLNAKDIEAAFEAAVNATPATWCYHDSNKAQHVVAGYVPVAA